jgi:glycosyltransferase involved in cell wall biosynthesis
MPTISIITICFNNLPDVLNTCQSVDVQTLPPFEHRIINGSTKPDIQEYFEQNPQPPFRRAIHERDKGIADAFNKGIEAAKGEVTILLNSGDTLYDPSVLKQVAAAFDRDPNLMWLHGKLHMLRGGIWVDIGKPFSKAKLYRGMRSVLHPTMFVKKEVYGRRGNFDLDLKIAMDYDFLCRIADEPNTFLDIPISSFDPTGVSTLNYREAMRETFEAYRRHFGPTFKQTLWGWRLTLIHTLLATPLGKSLYKLKAGLGAENL